MIHCGVDIVETSRIENAIENSQGAFRDRVYTEAEIRYCEGRRAGRYQSYAARFAAKEAVTKALGTGIGSGINFKDIEIINDSNGKPTVRLYAKAREAFDGIGGSELSISLSHCKSYGVANCVILTKDHSG